MSLNKEVNNDKKEKNEMKIIKLSSSFVKERKNKDEEKKNNSKDKYSKSHKKYNYLKRNINFIDKKNTLIKSVQIEKNKNELFNNDTKDIKDNSNIKETNLNYNTYKNKKYLSIKVINYRVEENKKNKNIGFYFSKYSNSTTKPKNNNNSKID